jgi:hypothetical protein
MIVQLQWCFKIKMLGPFRFLASCISAALLSACSASTPLDVDYSQQRVIGTSSPSLTGYVSFPGQNFLLFPRVGLCQKGYEQNSWYVKQRDSLEGCKSGIEWRFMLLDSNGKRKKTELSRLEEAVDEVIEKMEPGRGTRIYFRMIPTPVTRRP